MPFESFYERFPDLAKAETRSVMVFEDYDGSDTLPPADYGFLEMYCNEPGCDCRRVFLNVVSSRTKKSEAMIAYGWESAQFYRNWFKHATVEDVTMLQGPELNVGSPQGEHAEAILQLFIDTLLPRAEYIERVKRTTNSSAPRWTGLTIRCCAAAEPVANPSTPHCSNHQPFSDQSMDPVYPHHRGFHPALCHRPRITPLPKLS